MRSGRGRSVSGGHQRARPGDLNEGRTEHRERRKESGSGLLVDERPDGQAGHGGGDPSETPSEGGGVLRSTNHANLAPASDTKRRHRRTPCGCRGDVARDAELESTAPAASTPKASRSPCRARSTRSVCTIRSRTVTTDLVIYTLRRRSGHPGSNCVHHAGISGGPGDSRAAGIIVARAPVAQWIERRPPEPDRLSVVATRVGLRAKRVEFYALPAGRFPGRASDSPSD
jgi:hypothetical protein